MAAQIKQEGDSRDRAVGVLVGLAAGDKNHGPSEMAWRLATSLAELQRFDPEDVFARYLQWHREESYDTGRVAEIVFDLALDGVGRSEAVARAHKQLEGMTAGVNPAHRVAPVTLLVLAGFKALFFREKRPPRTQTLKGIIQPCRVHTQFL